MATHGSANAAPSVGQSDTGIVTRLFPQKKYGFIKSDKVGTLLLPYSELIPLRRSARHNSTENTDNLPAQLVVGAEVKYVLGRNHKGWVAHKCTVISPSGTVNNSSTQPMVESLGMDTESPEIKDKKAITATKPFLVKDNCSDAVSIEELVDPIDASVVSNYLQLFSQVLASQRNPSQSTSSAASNPAPSILQAQFWLDMTPARLQEESLRQFSLAQLQLLRNDTNSHEWKEAMKNHTAVNSTGESSANLPLSPICEFCLRTTHSESKSSAGGSCEDEAQTSCTCRLMRIKSNYTTAAEKFLIPLARHLGPSDTDNNSAPPVITTATATASSSTTPSVSSMQASERTVSSSSSNRQYPKKRAKVTTEDSTGMEQSSNNVAPNSTPVSVGPDKSSLTNALSLLSLIQSMHASITEHLLEDAGRFRDGKNVRCGLEKFIPHTQLPQALKSFVGYITDSLLPRTDLHCYSKAAMVMFQFVRIHPFSDGNGRVSRMLGNWVLMKSGLPFPVQFCPSTEKRKEYVAACRFVDPRMMCKYIASCVANTCRQYDSTVQVQMASLLRNWNSMLSTTTLSTSSSTSTDANAQGAFSQLDSEGMSHTEKQSKVVSAAEKQAAELTKATELVFADEGRLKEAANLYRKRQQNESECVICFESCPSISLLCCGSSCHVGCLSRWRLTQRQDGSKKCPYCRYEFNGADKESLNRVKVLSEVLGVNEDVAQSLSACADMYERGIVDNLTQMFMRGHDDGDDEDDDDDTWSTYDDDDEDDDDDESTTSSHDDNSEDDMPDLVGSDTEEEDNESMPDLLSVGLEDSDSDGESGDVDDTADDTAESAGDEVDTEDDTIDDSEEDDGDSNDDEGGDEDDTTDDTVDIDAPKIAEEDTIDDSEEVDGDEEEDEDADEDDTADDTEEAGATNAAVDGDDTADDTADANEEDDEGDDEDDETGDDTEDAEDDSDDTADDDTGGDDDDNDYGDDSVDVGGDDSVEDDTLEDDGNW